MNANRSTKTVFFPVQLHACTLYFIQSHNNNALFTLKLFLLLSIFYYLQAILSKGFVIRNSWSKYWTKALMNFHVKCKCISLLHYFPIKKIFFNIFEKYSKEFHYSLGKRNPHSNGNPITTKSVRRTGCHPITGPLRTSRFVHLDSGPTRAMQRPVRFYHIQGLFARVIGQKLLQTNRWHCRRVSQERCHS